MKGLLWLCVVMITAPPLNGQNKLVVTVEAIREQKGSVMVGLFRTKDDFMKKATYGKVVPANSEKVHVIFENLEPGEYGISIIHDINDNGELDTNAFGIPKEGFGFGNNAMGLFGPPSFEKAKIAINRDEVQHVLRVKYF